MNDAFKIIAIIVSFFFIGYFTEEAIDAAYSQNDKIKDMVEHYIEVLSELVSIFISFSIFTISWNAYGKNRDNHSIFLGATFLVVGILSLFHLLSYPFMPDFITPNSSHKSAFFLIDSRLILTICFLGSAYIYKETLPGLINRSILLASAIVVSAISLVLGLFYHTSLFPAYDPDAGYTGYGISLFYIAAILYASYLYAKRLRETGQENLRLLIYGSIIIIFSIFVYFSYEISGHFLIITGFYFIYLALYKSSVELPYEKLAIAEEKLRHTAEEKYRNLFDNANDAIVTIDLEENITSWNKTAEKTFGWDAEEIIGKKFSKLIVPQNILAKKDMIVHDAISGRVISGIDVKCPRKDGGMVDVNLTVSPIRDINHDVIGLSGIMRDITERKNAEETLAESEEKFRNLFDNATDGIMLADIETKKQYMANKNICKMLGYSPEEILNLSVMDLHPEKDLPWIIELFEKQARGESSLIENLPVKRKDGTVFYADINTSPLNIGGKLYNMGIFRDITDRRRNEEMRRENERLALANKAKSEFLAVMGHELRTPLNSVIGFSEILKQKTVGELNERQEHFVDNVLVSGKHLLHLINDILDITGVESGKIDFVREDIPVVEVINETLDSIKEKATKQNIVLKKEFDPQLTSVRADRRRFKQIFFNLLSNAVKFSKKEGGTVTVTTKKEGDMARFSVSDTGIGIKKEDMGRLFKEFEQLDSGISRSYGGTGLGLAISKKLVELHGGKIMVESKYGEGSNFTFLLPLVTKKNR